jgi:hypothetical protein
MKIVRLVAAILVPLLSVTATHRIFAEESVPTKTNVRIVNSAVYGQVEISYSLGPVRLNCADSTCDAWGADGQAEYISLQKLIASSAKGVVSVPKRHLTDLANVQQVLTPDPPGSLLAVVLVKGGDGADYYGATFRIGENCGYTRTIEGELRNSMSETLSVRNEIDFGWLEGCVTRID